MAYSNIMVGSQGAVGGAAALRMDEMGKASLNGPNITVDTRPIPAALDELSKAVAGVNGLLEALHNHLERAGVLRPCEPGAVLVATTSDKEPQSEMEARIRSVTTRVNGAATGVQMMLTHLQL